jgi:transposase
MARKQYVYWLSDAEWETIQPHLPSGRRGARRVDDRRVISGIMHMLRSGGRWKDCPTVYGPYTTIYNRWNRWSRQGVWERIFYALTGSSGVFTGSVDSTHIKAHRSAAGAKGGLVIMPLAPRAAGERQKSMR